MEKIKDTTTGIRVSGIRIGRAELRGVLIELTGEFDVHDLGTLRRTFDDTLSSGLPTYVDLSGVAFLDAACTRELAAQYHLYGLYGRLLALRDPSWQAARPASGPVVLDTSLAPTWMESSSTRRKPRRKMRRNTVRLWR